MNPQSHHPQPHLPLFRLIWNQCSDISCCSRITHQTMRCRTCALQMSFFHTCGVSKLPQARLSRLAASLLCRSANQRTGLDLILAGIILNLIQRPALLRLCVGCQKWTYCAGDYGIKVGAIKFRHPAHGAITAAENVTRRINQTRTCLWVIPGRHALQ